MLTVDPCSGIWGLGVSSKFGVSGERRLRRKGWAERESDEWVGTNRKEEDLSLVPQYAQRTKRGALAIASVMLILGLGLGLGLRDLALAKKLRPKVLWDYKSHLGFNSCNVAL